MARAPAGLSAALTKVSELRSSYNKPKEKEDGSRENLLFLL